jgi:uncharacterized protein YqcC (DUF446 family)
MKDRVVLEKLEQIRILLRELLIWKVDEPDERGVTLRDCSEELLLNVLERAGISRKEFYERSKPYPDPRS